MTDLISIIIPCFNSGADLPETLGAVAAQTHENREVIVVDDGSTDPLTLSVLADLPPWVRLIRQPNRGLAAARNAGFAAARGDFLLPLDSDDILEPAFLETCLSALRSRPDAAFSFSGLRLMGEKSGVLSKTYNFAAQLFLNQLPYCLMMRRSTWDRSGGYDEAMRQGYEDWEFNIRLGGMGLFGVAVDQPLFVYRVRSSGMLSSVSRKRHAQLWRFIRRKHASLYSPASLWATFRKWRQGLPYPRSFLLALLVLHSTLPDTVFNRIFALLQGFSASSRATNSVK